MFMGFGLGFLQLETVTNQQLLFTRGWHGSSNLGAQIFLRPSEAPRAWYESKPGVGRVADGGSYRTQRLRALGNSIVPQVAYELFRGIKLERIKNQVARPLNKYSAALLICLNFDHLL